MEPQATTVDVSGNLAPAGSVFCFAMSQPPHFCTTVKIPRNVALGGFLFTWLPLLSPQVWKTARTTLQLGPPIRGTEIPQMANLIY